MIPSLTVFSLRLEAEPVKVKKDKYELLYKFLKTHPGSTLIYATLQKVIHIISLDYSQTLILDSAS
jgi:hypothetical protein